jgi:hypothetical protein
MAQDFHLKLITERASGGAPIVRERRVSGPEASIGRALDSDIVLTDLSVDPRHAVLRSTGAGRVTLESVSGIAFEANGRSTQRAELNVADRPQIAFGTYRLGLEPGEAGEVVVTVTRVEPEHHPSPSAFSLQASMFGRRRMAWMLGLGILLVCLLVPILWTALPAKIHPDQQWSSGPLSRSHAFLEDDCKSCHVKAFVAVRDDACLTCHTADGGLVEKTRLISFEKGAEFRPMPAPNHWRTGREDGHRWLREGAPASEGIGAQLTGAVAAALGRPGERCATCHVEHTPAREANGAPATGPAADKPHVVAEQTCESCHTGLKDRLAKRGKAIEYADVPAWTAAAGQPQHPEFRPKLINLTGRVALRPGLKEVNGLNFSHQQHLEAGGSVTRQALSLPRYGGALDCASCHERKGEGYRPIEMERDCESCHTLAFARVGGRLVSLPHGDEAKALQAYVRTLPGSGAAGFRAAVSPGGLCYGCHAVNFPAAGRTASPVKITDRYLSKGGFNHAITAHDAFNGKGKAAARCETCHAARTSTSADDLLLRGKDSCTACHAPQPTEKNPALAGGAACETCHSFHNPGLATPGHPLHPRNPDESLGQRPRPLDALRWTANEKLRLSKAASPRPSPGG